MIYSFRTHLDFERNFPTFTFTLKEDFKFVLVQKNHNSQLIKKYSTLFSLKPQHWMINDGTSESSTACDNEEIKYGPFSDGEGDRITRKPQKNRNWSPLGKPPLEPLRR